MDDLQYSEGSEGSALREHVDRWQAHAAATPPPDNASPRSALLSPDSQESSLPSSGHRRSRRSSRSRRREPNSYTTRELAKILREDEYEVRELRRAYNHALDRLDAESQRAAYAEQRVLDLGAQLREANDLRVTAELEAARAKEEVALYKAQCDALQQEVLRAQEAVNNEQAARADAEAAAARARRTARQLNQERLLRIAREEGRRIGFEEGLKMGRSMGYGEGRAIGYDDGRTDVRDAAYRMIEDELGEDGLEGEEEGEEGEGDTYERSSEGLPHALRNFPPPSEPEPDPAPIRERDYADARPRSTQPQPIPPRTTTPGARMPTPAQPVPTHASPRSPSFMHPVPIHNAAPSPRHPDVEIPPDNWIPPSGPDNYIHLPPPHELNRTPSPGPGRALSRSPGAYAMPLRSPSAVSDTLPRSRTPGAEQSIRRSPSPAPPPVPPKEAPPPSNTSARPILTREFTAQLHAQPSFPDSLSSGSHAKHGQGSLGLNTFRSPRARPLSVINEGMSERGSVRSGGRSRRQSRAGVDEAYVPTQPYGSPARSARDVAEGLRYSDPDVARSMRRAASEQSKSGYGYAGPPRHRPAHLTTPAPLASGPGRTETPGSTGSRHQRSYSVASPRRAPSSLSGSFYHRRAASSEAPPSVGREPPPSDGRRSRTQGPYMVPVSPSPLRQGSPLPPQASPRLAPQSMYSQPPPSNPYAQPPPSNPYTQQQAPSNSYYQRPISSSTYGQAQDAYEQPYVPPSPRSAARSPQRAPSRLAGASPRHTPIPVPAPTVYQVPPYGAERGAPPHEHIYMRPLDSSISRSQTPQAYSNPAPQQQGYTNPNLSPVSPGPTPVYRQPSHAGTPGPSSAGWSPRSPSVRMVPMQQYANAGATPGARLSPLPADSEKPKLKKVSSASSLRSSSSYGRYNPAEALDPSTFVESDLVKDSRDTLSANSPRPKMTRLRSTSPGHFQ